LDEAGWRIAIALDDLTLRIVKLPVDADATPRLLRSGSGTLTSIAICNALIAAGSQGGAAYVWNSDDGSTLAHYTDLTGAIAGLSCGMRDDAATAATPAFHVVAVADDGSGMSWEVDQSATTKFPFRACQGPVVDTAMNYLPYLACASANEVHIWSIAPDGSPHEIATLHSDDTIYAIALDPKARWCALGHANGDITMMPVPRQRDR
jgi:hypothetical protein